MFPSYLEQPQNCQFEGQDPDEKIILLLRPHFITNLSWIFSAVILAFLPLFLPKIASLLGQALPALPVNFTAAFLILNYLLVGVIVFEGFLGWYFNVNIVTNKRVIDIDFHSLLLKNVDLAPLQSIQEASGSVGGLMGVIFNFGDVFIQTAGSKVSMDFDKVPNPTRVADIILDLSHNLGGPNAP